MCHHFLNVMNKVVVVDKFTLLFLCPGLLFADRDNFCLRPHSCLRYLVDWHQYMLYSIGTDKAHFM
jgi:hypothetical protein